MLLITLSMKNYHMMPQIKFENIIVDERVINTVAHKTILLTI